MDSYHCPTPPAECAPSRCHWRCAPDVIDDLLCQPGAATAEEVDLLLELRSLLRHRAEGETVLRLFCDLRRRMETRHYLAFFRMRRWLENHLVAAVYPCPVAEPDRVRVRLDHYCVEAIRRACLCVSLSSGVALLAPRVRFEFRPMPAAAPVEVEAAIADKTSETEHPPGFAPSATATATSTEKRQALATH